jgi:hypothetical protein
MYIPYSATHKIHVGMYGLRAVISLETYDSDTCKEVFVLDGAQTRVLATYLDNIATSLEKTEGEEDVQIP